MVIDLFCAGLTTICELVLPMIIRFITNAGMNDLVSLTVTVILRLGALYLLLRIVDSMANFYMAYTGHVMGTRIETDMPHDLTHFGIIIVCIGQLLQVRIGVPPHIRLDPRSHDMALRTVFSGRRW